MAEAWRPGTLPLRAADLPTVMAGSEVVVVHFWAAWNRVDRLFAPVLEGVRSEFEGRIVFRSANVDDEGLATLCRECKVVNVPALGCFVGGQRVKTIVGSRPAAVLRAEFADLLAEVATPNQSRRWEAIGLFRAPSSGPILYLAVHEPEGDDGRPDAAGGRPRM